MQGRKFDLTHTLVSGAGLKDHISKQTFRDILIELSMLVEVGEMGFIFYDLLFSLKITS